MKKIILFAAAFLFVFYAAFTLTACGGTKPAEGPKPYAVTKTLLNGSITQAKALNKDNYMYTGWQGLKSALASAEEATGKSDATQEEINAAKANLDIAIYELVPDDMAKVDWAGRAQDYTDAYYDKFERTQGTTRKGVREYWHSATGSYLWPHFCTLIMQYRLVKLDPANAANLDRFKAQLDYFEYYRSSTTPTGGTGPMKYHSNQNGTIGNGIGTVFYDDNIWVARAFMFAYEIYEGLAADLEEAALKTEYAGYAATYKDYGKRVVDFVNSGWSDELGGLYWNETGVTGGNAQAEDLERGLSANGASIILNAWVHKTFSGAENYKDASGKKYIDWAYDYYGFCNRLQNIDNEDFPQYIYFNGIHTIIEDGIRKDGSINTALYSYNAGSVILADVYLYEITGDESHLVNARRSAAVAFEAFCADFDEVNMPGLSNLTKDPWFDSVLVDAFCELFPYDMDNVSLYLDKYAKSFHEGYVKEYDKVTQATGQGTNGANCVGLLPANVLSGWVTDAAATPASSGDTPYNRDRSALTHSGNGDMLIMIAGYYANLLQK